MTEPKVIVLRPFRFGETADAMVYGAQRTKADCGHDAWIAPSTVAFLETNPLPTICNACTPDGPIEVHMAPGTREELEQKVGTAWADQLVARAKDLGKAGRLKKEMGQ